MNILVIGGTRFFGVPMVKSLLKAGHCVTIASRGITKDRFGDFVDRIFLDISDYSSVQKALKGKKFDVVVDKVSYSSNEIMGIINAAHCLRFIYTSTSNVYQLDHFDIKESEFNGNSGLIKWCDRMEASYDINKKNSERVLAQEYENKNWVSVRYPIVLGKNDYTGRLEFYIEHIMNQKVMKIENYDSRICFVEETEAGEFMAFLVECNYYGPINGCSLGTISMREIIKYIESRTGKSAIIDSCGDEAPFNKVQNNSLNIDKAKQLGYHFSHLKDWIYELIDYYIEKYRQ